MMNLLIIRESICNFCQRFDRIVTPVIKFLYTIIVFLSWKQLFGYQEALYQWPVMLCVAFVCAFVPSSVVFVLSGILACVDTLQLNMEVTLLLLGFYLVVYLLYMRLVPKKSWIMVIAPIFMIRFPFFLPLLVAVVAGPAGIVPALCGIIIYYFSLHAHELEPLLTAAVNDNKVSPLQYLIDNMVADSEMLLYMVIFAVVIMVTYLFYQSAIRHSSSVAVVVGSLLMLIAMLTGSMLLDDEMNIAKVIVGCVLAGVFAQILCFFRKVVDYSRIETVQFEDDDYYYYVKAVPKITVTKKDINIQKINVRQSK